MKNTGKGQQGVGKKFPSFPEGRKLTSIGKVPPVGTLPAKGVTGGKSALGGKSK